MAIRSLEKAGKIPAGVFIDTVSAISVGLQGETVLVDLDYNEDSTCAVDMNFVMTGKGQFVEIQGTAEKGSFTKAEMDQMTEKAIHALAQVREIQVSRLRQVGLKL
jgi:ribonuclease PH